MLHHHIELLANGPPILFHLMTPRKFCRLEKLLIADQRISTHQFLNLKDDLASVSENPAADFRFQL